MVMKKCVHTIIVDNWFPEMCAITLPLMKAYAKKIGADLNIISKRLNPTWPVNYEKMQIWETGRGYVWNIYIDADIIIDPVRMPDFTELSDPRFFYYEAILSPKDQYQSHPYFIRDERNLGISDCFIMTSDLTHDLWHPALCDFDTAKRFCQGNERIVSEFNINLNIARFGLKGLTRIGYDDKHFHLQTTDDYNRQFNGGKCDMTKAEHLARALEKVKQMEIDLPYFQKQFRVDDLSK